MTENYRIIRLPEVTRVTGICKTNIYELIKKNKFPKQINLGARSVGWVESEVKEWIQQRIADRDLI
ncbi:AlpA family transcriptional regulator [Desulfopila sp. IMCC35008]|uniref:helix-turn-helix transcriptional regulator n=1 Tax=Desulfopila sp. IMCC35008 TaxID=2653858 RepID=UPI0013D7A538|nr:AlpA family transcriptional regulator [Desulfopila sp. IMCC35008]